MDGIELAARFSYITNSLRFCGPEKATELFLKYIQKQASSESVKDSLKKFEGLYPYLSVISQKTKKDMFDFEVVESYWIGNDLLKGFDKEDMKEIVQKLMERGLPKSIGEKLIKKMPDGFVPHHNFNVFYVGVGKTTGSVETTLQNMDNCRISWGQVIEVHGDKLLIDTQSIKNTQGVYSIGNPETKTAVFLKEMLPNVKKDDFVALHWGFAPMILNEKQVDNLKKYTQLILDVINKN